MKVARGGGTPVTLAGERLRPSSIAVDGVSAYWIEGTSVMKLTPK